MEYSPDTCACFTGHRAMTESDIKEVATLISKHVAELYTKGIKNYYAGGALGFDLAAAVTALICVIPLIQAVLNTVSDLV
jgi:uncharacterized phage-like protein YoqJ